MNAVSSSGIFRAPNFNVDAMGCGPYASGVRHFRRIWLLALAAALFGVATPQAFAAWQCEGQTCGTVLLWCCCNAPDGFRDANCRTGTEGAPAGGSLACGADCNCVLTVLASDTARIEARSMGLTIPAALPAARPLPLPEACASAGVSYVPETRGPPRPPLCLSRQALRGPPALTFQPIGP
jgi:hypothetical protein